MGEWVVLNGVKFLAILGFFAACARVCQAFDNINRPPCRCHWQCGKQAPNHHPKQGDAIFFLLLENILLSVL